VCCPNDPDDARLLSEVSGAKVDEIFIGSCMTNIGHFRAAGKLLDKAGSVDARFWICPPTRMDAHTLMEEGYYNIYGRVGARTEMPGCSLCMGNQARVLAGATVMSTSTRNFPNRLGDGADVYLASAELSAVGGVLGRLPSPAEYLEYAKQLDSMSSEIYRYMNFDQIESFHNAAEEGKLIAAEQIVEVS
jgi:aconitate hydratase 2/2-methylisocitrate dehydratase